MGLTNDPKLYEPSDVSDPGKTDLRTVLKKGSATRLEGATDSTEIGNDGDSLKVLPISSTASPLITDDPQREQRRDSSNSLAPIYGESNTLGAAQTSALWRIWREVTTGSQFLKEYAQLVSVPNSGFVHKWSERDSIFGALPFLNEFSMQADGTGDYYLLVAHTTDLNFGINDGMSFAASLKTTDTGVANVLINKQDGANEGWRMEVDGSGRFIFELRGPISGNRIEIRCDGFNVKDGAWHRLVITKASGSSAASSAKLYIDGNDETVTVVADTLTSMTMGTDDIGIFGTNAGGSRLQGKLDSVAVWNAELTAAEVIEDYNSNAGEIDLKNGSGQLSSALVSWWRMGDGSFVALPNIPDEQSGHTAVSQGGFVTGDIESEVRP